MDPHRRRGEAAHRRGSLVEVRAQRASRWVAPANAPGALGINVVIDFGLWARDERSALRQAAVDLGAAVETRYFELPPAEQRRRLDRRQAEDPHTTWHMSDEELAAWAAIISVPTQGELDGSEPLDAPPAGFLTWESWRRHRWPPSVP